MGKKNYSNPNTTFVLAIGIHIERGDYRVFQATSHDAHHYRVFQVTS